MLWDFRIQTEKHLLQKTPDLTIVDKKDKKVWTVDIAIPRDCRIEEKELEKITKYKDLQIEVEQLWQKKAKIVPIVIGTLDVIPKHLEHHWNTIGIDKSTTSQLQKTALIGTLTSCDDTFNNNICLTQVLRKDLIGGQKCQIQSKHLAD